MSTIRELNAHIKRIKHRYTEDEIKKFVLIAQSGALGSIEARHLVVEQHLGLVAALVSVFAAPENQAESIQEGCLGLCRAVDVFRNVNGARFGTYAYYWVKQSIIRWYKRHHRNNLPLISLESSNVDDEYGPINWIIDETSPAPDEGARQRMGEELLEELMQGLPRRSRAVLNAYYWHGKTLQEVGEQFGLTRERIRQISQAAIEKMREKYDKQQCAR